MAQIDKAVKELKRLKTEVQRLSALVNEQGDNVFEAQVTHRAFESHAPA